VFGCLCGLGLINVRVAWVAGCWGIIAFYPMYMCVHSIKDDIVCVCEVFGFFFPFALFDVFIVGYIPAPVCRTVLYIHITTTIKCDVK